MENNYKLMDESDKIPQSWNRIPFAIYVAFGFHQEIVAVGSYEKVYSKAIIRRCSTPLIENAGRCLNQKLVNSHNNLLQKALSEKENNKKTNFN